MRDWDLPRAELEKLRAERAEVQPIYGEDGTGRRAASLEAALCMTAGLPESRVGQWYDERILCVEDGDHRRAGLQATEAELVCFLDNDVRLTPDYLRSGIESFGDDERVGLVYADVDRFAIDDPFTQPEQLTVDALSRWNLSHPAVLIRREALESSLRIQSPVSTLMNDDWLLWRRILEHGWQATKQQAICDCRAQQRVPRGNYFDLRGLKYETVAVLVRLADDSGSWTALRDWLVNQEWPHNQTRLIVADPCPEFAHAGEVREWLSRSDYPDIRYFMNDRATIGRDSASNFVMTLKSGVLPPNDVIEKLLRGFDHDTAAVTALVPDRTGNGYEAWTEGGRQILEKPQHGCPNYSLIEASGLGCMIFRTPVLLEAPFAGHQSPDGSALPFYTRLRAGGWKVQLCWEAECEGPTSHNARSDLQSRP